MMLSFSREVLRTLVYADIFDYPLTLEEIHRFLIGQNAKRLPARLAAKRAGEVGKTQNEIQRELAGESHYVSHISYHDGFYFLRGRKRIVSLRKKREWWSRKKLKIGRRVVEWLGLIPWVKMVGVTGALAMNNTRENDDIDFLIVAAKNRLWLTRVLAVLLIEFLGKRRRPKDKKVQDKICLNMFLDEGHLGLPKKEQDLFTAHEICQLKPLWNKDGTYEKFLWENRWVRAYLPNWEGETKRLRDDDTKRARREKQKLSNVLVSLYLNIFSLVESLAYRVQLSYMKPRQTIEVVEPYRILFHPQGCREWVLRKYEKRRQKIESCLLAGN